MSNYTSTTVHEGSMRCVTNFPQGDAKFTTDVGSALGGRGEQPSPAQLLAAAVASCMASMMAFMGARRELNTSGISIEAGYEEGKNGITALNFHITVPHPTTSAERAVLEASVKGCPVGAAIAPTVEKKISWTWAE
ncbi:MAG: OsmC family protein [Akkermansiaceae bacterium]|nr:OsmC family protein [Akkermansiaceae bacterium]